MQFRPLSATPALRRLQFGHFSESDQVNSALRKKILSRDNNTCVDCKLKLPRHMEVRHLDDNHDNGAEENLACVCPFCHCRDHLHTTGFARAGLLIGSTAQNQAVINSISLACWYILDRIPDDTDIRVIPSAEADEMKALRQVAELINLDFHTKSLRWGDAFGKLVTEPDAFAEALSDLSVQQPEAYAARSGTTKHLHVLPLKSAFHAQCTDWFLHFDKVRPISSWIKGLDSWLGHLGMTREELAESSKSITRRASRTEPPKDLGRPIGKPSPPSAGNLVDPFDSLGTSGNAAGSRYD
ncbi:HNH endonuclease [Paracidovorax wautersii]|uniref:HNH nuclease domain-containing protein n=1 Tax=Paracidovorax wautersii TaxID=1177982 RepID=A0A1I2HNV7_9BURK|nr:HNH endonuclease [Paracidovorax wautersii]SFF31489.1 hypothetical protein SAMN04489711_1272 [Paracidovorax wautersii]